MLAVNKKTLYDVLSVKECASYEEIRARYKAAVLSSHPDKLFAKSNTIDSDIGQEGGFPSIQKAWEVLCDPKSRANYDKELRATRQKLEVVAERISLDEMDVEAVGDVEELSYQCGCGDYFSVTSTELLDIGIPLGKMRIMAEEPIDMPSVSILLPCSSCSLKIHVMVTN